LPLATTKVSRAGQGCRRVRTPALRLTFDPYYRVGRYAITEHEPYRPETTEATCAHPPNSWPGRGY
jgi:hypothetical protein